MKNLFIIVFGTGLCISIIYLINFISIEYFEYSIPFWLNLLFMYWGSQILNKVSPFKETKIVLFEKRKQTILKGMIGRCMVQTFSKLI